MLVDSFRELRRLGNCRFPGYATVRPAIQVSRVPAIALCGIFAKCPDAATQGAL
jgi:hypothetical protein